MDEALDSVSVYGDSSRSCSVRRDSVRRLSESVAMSEFSMFQFLIIIIFQQCKEQIMSYAKSCGGVRQARFPGIRLLCQCLHRTSVGNSSPSRRRHGFSVAVLLNYIFAIYLNAGR